ncbi:MAG: 4-(cytidine 5'-diphospho)-2-C-methyl-D-erythritol kinase [Meiothermus sp.]
MPQYLAGAKINLGLSVLGKLPNGYHELHTIFAALEVADRIELEPTAEGIQLEIVNSALPSGPSNLAYRAARDYLEAAGWPGGVRMVLEKHLPLAAGLGGGSSDAAAVLRGLNELYPANLDLSALALKLGADVPFFLGSPLAEGRGIGEKLRPLPPMPLEVVLVNPGIAVAAADAYKGLRREEWSPELNVGDVLGALRAGQEPPYWNTLEGPVSRLEPSLAEVKLELRKAGLFGILMSGSGSTLFGLAKDADEAAFIAGKLRARHPNFWIQDTRTVV